MASKGLYISKAYIELMIIITNMKINGKKLQMSLISQERLGAALKERSSSIENYSNSIDKQYSLIEEEKKVEKSSLEFDAGNNNLLVERMLDRCSIAFDTKKHKLVIGNPSGNMEVLYKGIKFLIEVKKSLKESIPTKPGSSPI